MVIEVPLVVFGTGTMPQITPLRRAYILVGLRGKKSVRSAGCAGFPPDAGKIIYIRAITFPALTPSFYVARNYPDGRH